MLDDFIRTNRDEIVARTRSKVAERSTPRPTQEELIRGIPILLDSLAVRLRGEAPSLRTLNRCVDLATAVGELEHQRNHTISDEGTERFGALARDLCNQLNSAVMAFDIIKRGSVGVGGSVGALLGRSLSDLRDTIDRTLAEVRRQ